MRESLRPWPRARAVSAGYDPLNMSNSARNPAGMETTAQLPELTQSTGLGVIQKRTFLDHRIEARHSLDGLQAAFWLAREAGRSNLSFMGYGWEVSAVLLMAVLATGCSGEAVDGSDGGGGAAGAGGAADGSGTNGAEPVPCDPLSAEEQPITLSGILAVGEAEDGTLFVVDDVGTDCKSSSASSRESLRG
jgi:hypothetical protein